jgi:four helix bundle protein
VKLTERFNFEKLDVWTKAVEFADKILDLVENIETDRKHYRLFEQIESAATSVSMNIAEGKGRFSKKEFVHYLYISRGSLFESVTLLTIFEKRKWITKDSLEKLKEEAALIGKMLNSLINKIKYQEPTAKS